MFKSDEVIRTLESDPYEHLGDIRPTVKRICQLLRVTEYEKVLTKTGYCRINATVQFQSDGKMEKVGVARYTELFFEYEREGTHNPGEQTSVWYSIDVARDDGPREKVLWVKVFAAGDVPSSMPAKNLDELMTGDNDDDGWEDMDESGDEDDIESTEQAESKLKKARLHEDEPSKNTGGNDEDEKMEDRKDQKDEDEDEKDEESAGPPMEDRFTAGMDPDALEQFLHWTQLGKMEDITVFFLLVSFPFYEMEFDLVGFVLDAVFGPDDDDDDDDDEEDDEKEN